MSYPERVSDARWHLEGVWQLRTTTVGGKKVSKIDCLFRKGETLGMAICSCNWLLRSVSFFFARTHSFFPTRLRVAGPLSVVCVCPDVCFSSILLQLLSSLLPNYLSFYLFASVCLPVRLSVCVCFLPVVLHSVVSVCPDACLPVCLLVCLTVCLYPFQSSSFLVSFCLPACLSAYLSVCVYLTFLVSFLADFSLSVAFLFGFLSFFIPSFNSFQKQKQERCHQNDW